MANAGPDTNGSQFFICIEDCQDKLQPLYNLFGNVTSGIEVAQAIQVGDKMHTVTVADSRSSRGTPMAVVEVPEELNLAAVHEAIAAAVPDRECLVWRDRRLTWADVTDRSRRLAGGPARRPGSAAIGRSPTCEGWESPHDHVALYLHNGNEYLEALLGAGQGARGRRQHQLPLRGRGAPLRPPRQRRPGDRLPRRLRPHARARCCPRSPSEPLLLQVDDDSATPLLPGALEYEAALAGADAATARGPAAPTTSTSSTPAAPPACPRACCGDRPTSSPRASGIDQTTEQLVDGARRARACGRSRRRRSCTAPPTGTRCRRGRPAARW